MPRDALGSLPPASHERAASQPEFARATEAEMAALLDAVFGATQVGLAYVDRDLRYRRISPFLAAMNGQPVEAHIGRRPSEVLGAPGAVLEELLRGILASGEALPQFDVETLTPRGDAVHLRASFIPVRVSGAIVGICGIILDITAAKQAEASARAREPSS